MENISILSYIIVCPLVFIAGFIDAIAGGGGLITLPAYLIAGLPPHNAIATNKMSSTLGTATATVRYAINGYVPWKLALVCAAFAIGGSSIGANISLSVDDKILTVVMLFLLPVTAFVIARSRFLDTDPEPCSKMRTLFTSVIVAFVLGMYDGFYGPGTGTFLIILLTAAARLKLTEANGVTKVINFSSNISALTVYLVSRKVILPLGLTAAVFSIAGNWLGSRAFSQKGAKIAKPIMLAVIAVFIVKILYELVSGET